MNKGTLYQTNKEMERLLNSISDGVIAIREDYVITWHNTVLASLFDLPEIVRGEMCYKILFQKDAPCEDCPMRQVLQTCECFHTSLKIDEEKTYSLRVHCVKDDDGNPIGVVESISDISKEEKARQYLEDAKNRAEEANRQKSEFFANVSHEIRTPLNAVIGFSELLHGLNLGGKKQSYVSAILKAGKGLLTIINDILDISKVEAGQMEIRLAPVNVVDIVRDVVDIFQDQVNQKHLNIDFTTDLCHESLVIDEARLRQILVNLVGNAVKFTVEGGICLKVTGELKEHNSKVDLKIVVQDTGIGIDPSFIDHIFEVYSQEKSIAGRLTGGTGLGLAITHKLVRKMGGNIQLDSVVGEGTVFTVSLDDVAVAAYDVSSSNEIQQKTRVVKDTKILIVDDIESNRFLLDELLTGIGATTCLAENGKEALDVVERDRPDLIIMDIRMPGMNGIVATSILKDSDELRDIPVIALTASARPEEIKEIHGIFEGCLLKPVSSVDLFAELGKYLELSVTKNDETETESELDIVDIVAKVDADALKQWNSLASLYYQCRDLIVLTDIERFAQELIAFGEQEDFVELVAMGENLTSLVKIFDFKGIESYLQKVVITFDRRRLRL